MVGDSGDFPDVGLIAQSVGATAQKKASRDAGGISAIFHYDRTNKTTAVTVVRSSVTRIRFLTV